MYLEHFKLKQLPFALTPNTAFYCELPGHEAALNVLLFSLRSGEGFIKVTGEVGSGKTLLCRKLLAGLDDHFVTAYIPNPDITPEGLRKSFAKELGISFESSIEQTDLLNLISVKLMEYRHNNRHVVLVVDEAQALSDECLEALRLLTNLETETEKLLQIVLFGQPELDDRLSRHHLRQLKQRITFSHRLKPVNKEEMEAYLCHRLSVAGHTQGMLFNRKARKALFHQSQGIPRLINILSHKALLVAYGRGEARVDHRAIQQATQDTESVTLASNKGRWGWSVGTLLFIGAITTILLHHFGLLHV